MVSTIVLQRYHLYSTTISVISPLVVTFDDTLDHLSNGIVIVFLYDTDIRSKAFFLLRSMHSHLIAIPLSIYIITLGCIFLYFSVSIYSWSEQSSFSTPIFFEGIVC